MNAVVFDLELVKRFKKGQLSEIVEIGACRVDLNTKMVTDQFQIYITPKSGYISKSTRKFINMNSEDVRNAVTFHMGIQQFAAWLRDDDYLCSWGRDDKIHFINQCTRNHVDLNWLKNYNNIQPQIGKLLTANNKNQLGLKNALILAGISPVGRAHRGIDDALNTAELFIKFADQIDLETNTFTANEEAQPQNKKQKVLRQI
jgi:inhibitor of KinA sporulation pathway (predicted exonuclease)